MTVSDRFGPRPFESDDHPLTRSRHAGLVDTGPARLEDDFELSAKAVDTIDLAVSTVNDKAIRPLVIAARAVVFGILIAVLGVVVVTMTSVALVRLLTVYVFGGRVWAADALLGVVFLAGGLLIWSYRSAPAPGGPS